MNDFEATGQWQVPRDRSSAAEAWTQQGTGPPSVNSGASGTYQSLRGEKCTPHRAVSLTHTWNRNGSHSRCVLSPA